MSNKISIIKYGKKFLKFLIFYNDLPVEYVFKIPSITIIIKSLIEKYNKFRTFNKPLFV